MVDVCLTAPPTSLVAGSAGSSFFRLQFVLYKLILGAMHFKDNVEPIKGNVGPLYCSTTLQAIVRSRLIAVANLLSVKLYNAQKAARDEASYIDGTMHKVRCKYRCGKQI